VLSKRNLLIVGLCLAPARATARVAPTNTNMQCKQCQKDFIVLPEDQEFYHKIDVPEPTLCPDCRQQRRLLIRNERKLYRRKCDLCGGEMITMYHPNGPYKVYCQECFWSDKWEATVYGRDFDFSKTFTEQFKDLFLTVPRLSLMNKEHVNSEYCNFTTHNKNSYMLLGSAENEDTYYSSRCFKNKNCCDGTNNISCELCYECVDCGNCYHCAYLQNSADCSYCEYGYDLKGCHNCFGCYSMTQGKFCVFNEQYSEKDYEQKVAELKKNPDKALNIFNEKKKAAVRKYADILKSTNCTGNAIYSSKNAKNCYAVTKIEDCKHVCDATNMKDGYDINNDDNSEMIYEAIGSETNYGNRFNDICWYSSDLTCCSLCFHSKNLFGCAGLKKNNFCIFNKQYLEEDYKKLKEKIIEHMKKTGEWGEFFSPSISPFGYNESLAADYFPLSKEEAKSKGYAWQDNLPGTFGKETVKLNFDYSQIADITKEVLVCEKCQRNYKVISQEAKFYKEMNVSVPKKCFDCRHLARIELKCPRKLWTRQCMRPGCANKFESPYAPDRPEKIYCEECYQKEIY